MLQLTVEGDEVETGLIFAENKTEGSCEVQHYGPQSRPSAPRCWAAVLLQAHSVAGSPVVLP